MEGQAEGLAAREFKDRTAGLIVFGIMETLLGAACGLMALIALSMTLAPALSSAPGGAGVAPSMTIPAVMFYVLLTIAFIWLGIGSMLARRWARALILTMSWMWLITGLLTMAYALLVLMLTMLVAAPAGQDITIAVVVMAALGGFLVLLPAAFVLFYRSPHVKATCEFKDPRPRWTDPCPLPVLALSLLLGFGAIIMLGGIPSSSAIPFFGAFLTGVPAAIAILLLAALFGWLTWATYKLKYEAWRATVILMSLLGLSGIITFCRMGSIDLYEKTNIPQQQIATLQQVGVPDPMNMVVTVGITSAAYFIYLLCIRKYFVRPPAGPAAETRGE